MLIVLLLLLRSNPLLLSKLTFDLPRGEKNSQQSLKFQKVVLMLHQTRAFLLLKNMLLSSLEYIFIYFCHIQNRKKKSIIYILHFSVIAPTGPFSCHRSNDRIWCFWAKMLTTSPVEASMFYLPLVSTFTLIMQFKRRKKKKRSVENNL